MTDTANILDMNEDDLLAQFKARDTLIESLRQQKMYDDECIDRIRNVAYGLEKQLLECQARKKVLEIPDVIRERRWRREALLEAADALAKLWGQSVEDIVGDLRSMAKELE
jgi:AMMECR1 domain-containing protein